MNCSFIIAGSRIRAIVALTPFDEFHKNSAHIIQRAVFGTNADGSLKTSLKFNVNNLVIEKHVIGRKTGY